MKSTWSASDKTAFNLSILLVLAWLLVVVYNLFPTLWLNIVAAFLPPLPLWLRLLRTGLPKVPAQKGGLRDYPASLVIFSSAALVDMVSLNLLSARVAELGVSPFANLLVSLLVVPVFILWVAVEVWAFKFLDEFHKHLVLETAAWAYALSLVFAFALEMAQRAGYLSAWTASDLLWPWQAGAWIPIALVVWRRYR
jgi:hypothetical protein